MKIFVLFLLACLATPAQAATEVYAGRIDGVVTRGGLYYWVYETGPPTPAEASLVGHRVSLLINVTRQTPFPPEYEGCCSTPFFETLDMNFRLTGPSSDLIDQLAFLPLVLRPSANIAEYLVSPFTVLQDNAVAFNFERQDGSGHLITSVNASFFGTASGSGRVLAIEYGGQEYTSGLNFDFRVTGGYFGLVPEPRAWMLMILGFGAIGGSMRRTRLNLDGLGMIAR